MDGWMDGWQTARYTKRPTLEQNEKVGKPQETKCEKKVFHFASSLFPPPGDKNFPIWPLFLGPLICSTGGAKDREEKCITIGRNQKVFFSPRYTLLLRRSS
jgi:hypothetical protein